MYQKEESADVAEHLIIYQLLKLLNLIWNNKSPSG